MFESRNKIDLIIEVWEKLDCESVGAAEIEAIESAVTGRFGKAAVDSPMIVARLLADEGAELRHSEIMQLFVNRQSNLPYDAAFRNVLDLSGLKNVLTSIRKLENLRKKYAAVQDKEGRRLVRETAQKGREEALAAAADKKLLPEKRQINSEIAEWLTLWMQSPEMFAAWVKLRRSSADFRKKFGDEIK